MEQKITPIWDEQGELRRGCTVRDALAWMVSQGGHNAGESVCVNGVWYRAGRLLYGPERPDVADRIVTRICDGYYRQLNISV